ncbi:MAG TPA: hypothetical protein VGD87_03730 [Archangium sp.]|jgi:hypothetical protein
MADKKQKAEEAAVDAQLFAMLMSAGGTQEEEAPAKAAAPAPKPASAGWGPKKK